MRVRFPPVSTRKGKKMSSLMHLLGFGEKLHVRLNDVINLLTKDQVRLLRDDRPGDREAAEYIDGLKKRLEKLRD